MAPATNSAPAYQLKHVSPHAMRVLKEHGLLTNDNREWIGNITEVYLDPSSLKEVCAAVFQDDFSKLDFYKDVDLEKVNRGLRDFLLKALGG